MKKFYFFICLLISLRATAQTGVSEPAFQPFDRAMQQFMQRWGIRGASVAVGTQGGVVYARAFGSADVAGTQPMQPYHLLRVASVSKPITALAVMQLVEQGHLRLTDKVFGPQGHLRRPYYLEAIRDPRIYDITVQQLLEHTAGWDRNTNCDGQDGCDPIDFPVYVARAMHAATPVADSTLIRFLLTRGLNTTPGTHYAYSNIGYLVLGKLLEAVTGQPYETWVRQQLLEPAGALEAHLGRNLPAHRLEREVSYESHYQTEACDGSGKVVPAAYGGFNLEAMGAHGGWVCSARSLVQLLQAVEGRAGQSGLLTPATLATMAQPSAVNVHYGKGWMVNAAGHRWHRGEMDGTGTYLVRTAGGYTWAILLNTRPASEACWQELDQLGWVAVQRVAKMPAHDLRPPTRNATELTALSDSGGVVLRWQRGTGTRCLVLVQAERPIVDFPLDGTRYAPTALSAPAALGTGTYVVANTAADSVRLPHLDASRRYHVRVVEYTENASTGFQPVYVLDGNPTLTLPATNGAVAAGGAVRLPLYPNPARTELTVLGVPQVLPYEVTTLLGQRLRTSVLVPNQTIPISDLQPGHYLVRFQLPERVVISRFVKE
ncbi:serine hydrolase [Hymenobacter aerilatus]|uniref:Serine hydrolase n=1 Tax=Hymenobacter aerilatus TaxID=2932251 RepID=A0A8T9T055_9BACT|nr:serine hydrolase [Hymenobacter aerilatus]UOR07247.1 serine hydrolase [Hymenobacter aerilatus]